MLLYEALQERALSRPIRWVPVWAFGLASILGAIDEAIQSFVPERYFDVRDIVFNVLAAAMALSARMAIGWVRERFR